MYRPEIDGLRAVAVLPVLFFHAGFGAFSGGFIGVDIFFAIGGFLITLLILKDLDGGEFSFAKSLALLLGCLKVHLPREENFDCKSES